MSYSDIPAGPGIHNSEREPAATCEFHRALKYFNRVNKRDVFENTTTTTVYRYYFDSGYVD